MDAVGESIRAFAASYPELPWIEGAGLDDDAFVSAVSNPGAFLDELVPDRPVVITSTLIFKSWTNSRALEIAGITAETPDPPNGAIERDPQTGEPTGTFLNRAIDLVYSAQPELSEEQLLADYRHALSKFSAHGVTAIMTASSGPETSVRAYDALAGANELKHRVRMCFAHSSTSGDDSQQISDFVAARERVRERFPAGDVRADCVKLFLDGFVLVHGGALLEDYADRPGFRGKPDIEYERLEKLVTELDAQGFQIKAHSIGTRSAREFIDAVEAAQTKTGEPSGLRHHISHAEVFHTDDIARMRKLGMPVEVTPMAAADGREEFEKVLGRERTRTLAHTFNSFIQDGVIVVFGNDWMGTDTVDAYESLSQPANIEVAVTRLKPGDTRTDIEQDDLFNEDERLSLPDAIAAYTINGAYLMHDEQDSGSIEVGKYADFVILDQNLFDVPVHSIHEVNVDMTIFGGEVVYQRR
jgi:predicted amidohydrolase YtcJ